jgi:hypothetical protein
MDTYRTRREWHDTNFSSRTSGAVTPPNSLVSVTTRIEEFIGIYDADSTLWGELSYWVNARLGRAHCSLCDVTHGLFRMKQEWRQCSVEIGVPFTTYHRNDAPSEALVVAQGQFPVVLARQGSVLTTVLTDTELAACNGSPSTLVTRLASFL